MAGQAAAARLGAGDVLMLENLRFHPGERPMILLLPRHWQGLAISMSVMPSHVRTERMRRSRHCHGRWRQLVKQSALDVQWG